MALFTPNAINAHVADPTDRYGLVTNSAVRKGIMYNLDKLRFIGNMIDAETIPKGELFIERLRFGNVGSEIHLLGTEILPGDQVQKRYQIFFDQRPRVTSLSFDKWEDFVTNVPHQQAAADRMAYELNLQEEQDALKLIILASRVANAESTEFLGGGIDNAGTAADMGAVGDTDAQKAATVLGLLDTIDEHWFDIASNDPERNVIIDSPIWYAMRDLDNVFPGTLPFFHGDMLTSASPSPADFADPHAVLHYKGFKIFRSQVAGLVFGVNRSNDEYRAGNFTSTAGVVFKRDCAAIVRASMPTFESDYVMNKQHTQTLATQLLGGGSWYSENSIELAYTS